jgi:hypothetical protein
MPHYFISDEGNPQRVELMQGFHGAGQIPPFIPKTVEFLQICGIDC